VLSDSHSVIATPSRTGRWLRERRTRIALWIAAIEAILVAIFHDVSRFSVFALAIVAVLTYFYAGRRTRSDTFHQTSWIFAISQLLAALAAIFAFIVFWSAIVLMAIFAIGALFYVFTDRR
jgi:cation transport ATPase